MNTTLRKEKSAFAAEHDNIVYLFPCNEDKDSDCYADSVWEGVIQNCAVETTRDMLWNNITPLQRKLTMLRADGYSDREIAKRCGMHPSQVASEIRAAGEAVRNHAPELIELIAA